MKYKVAIVDQDAIYLSRFAKAFGDKYADKMDIFSYSSYEAFSVSEDRNKFDMVMIAEGMTDTANLDPKMPIAILVGENDIDTVDGFRAICKYQKHEIIMKQILDFCLEGEYTRYTKKNVLGNTTKVIFVTSALGNVGTTSVAIGLAKKLASYDKKVLYLSFEKNPATNLFLTAQEDTCFSDVIYLIKSKKNNLMSRLENIIQRDESGVYFIPACRTVFDMNELKVSEIEPLLKELCVMGSYEAIIFDSLMSFDEIGYFACDYADNILLIGNGTTIGEQKTKQLQTALEIWDNEKNKRFISKTQVVYNKVNPANGLQVTQEMNVLGNIQEYQGMKEKDIPQLIAATNIFDMYL